MARARFRDYVRMVRGFNTFTELMRCDCINGYAVGRKVTGGQVRGIAITVFVNKKLSLRRLPLSNRVPRTFRLPSERSKDGFLEFVTDVQEARFSSLELTSRERPARSGISIGHVNVTAGTLGGLVRDRTDGSVVILSNNHVLADSNEGVSGDTIIQPGAHDGGRSPRDDIGTLRRFLPIDFTPGAQNRIDAAIAAPDDLADVAWTTVEIGPETPRVRRILSEDDLGDPVQKTGRTTEHTNGVVHGMFATVQVKYDMFKKATFVDQIIVSQPASEGPFSSGGDSGSLVYDDEGRVVGLLFAGSEGTETEPATTIVNPIHYVMAGLDVELLAEGDHPSAAGRTKKTSGKQRGSRVRRASRARRA